VICFERKNMTKEEEEKRHRWQASKKRNTECDGSSSLSAFSVISIAQHH
jgi:hypothetical protein